MPDAQKTPARAAVDWARAGPGQETVGNRRKGKVMKTTWA